MVQLIFHIAKKKPMKLSDVFDRILRTILKSKDNMENEMKAIACRLFYLNAARLNVQRNKHFCLGNIRHGIVVLINNHNDYQRAFAWLKKKMLKLIENSVHVA